MAWLHWIFHVTGSDYGARYGRYVPYSFLSGSGSDFGEYTVAGALIGHGLAYYRKHRCHGERKPGKKCRRISRHVVDGSPFCDMHHQAARAAGSAG